jgi:hypothetical protein
MNLVELLADEDESFYDQPCKFGHRIECHSVYCQSENPKAPRKCRRTWYAGGTVKDEDCEFFEKNEDYRK